MTAAQFNLFLNIREIFIQMPDKLPDGWSEIEYVPNLGLLCTVSGKREVLDISTNFNLVEARVSRLDCVRAAKELTMDKRYSGGITRLKPISEDKGAFGKNCNVRSCQRPNSALYPNNWMLTDAPNNYYCFHCAKDILDDANPSLAKDRGLPFDGIHVHSKFRQYLTGNF